MALAQFVNDQNAASQKMMANFQQLQEAQAAENAQQAQATAMQLTEGVNQIVRRQKEGELREEALGERAAEREYSEESILWQKKLKEDSLSHQAQMLERLNQQTQAVSNFVKDWETKRDKHQNMIDAIETRVEDLRNTVDPKTGQNYWEAAPGGVERYEQLQRYINGARAFREDNFRAGYTQAALRLLNETRSNILAGKDYMDLTNLMVDPNLEEMMPIQGMEEPDDDDVANLTDEDILSLEVNGGYIPGGLIGRDPDDPELKRFKNFNMLGFEAASDMIFDEQNLALMRSHQDQDKYKIIRMKEVKKTAEWLQPLREHEVESYRGLQARGLEATMQGMENVTDKIAQDPVGFWGGKGLQFRAVLGKREQRGAPTTGALADAILEETLKSVLGPKSEFFMDLLAGLNKPGAERKILDTPAEWYTGVELLNGLRVVHQNLNSLATAPGETGTPMLAQAAKNLVAGGARGPLASLVTALAPKAEAGITGRYTPATEMAVQDGLKRMIGEVRSKIVGLKSMMTNQPIFKGVRAKSEWVGQYGDALAFSYMSNKEPDLITPRGLTPTELAQMEAQVTAEGAPEGMGIEEFERQVELGLTPLAATAQLGMMFSNRSDLIPSMIAGGYTDHLPNAGSIMNANLVDLQADFGQQMDEIRAVLRQRTGEADREMGQQEQEGGEEQDPKPEHRPQPTGRGVPG
jgi:hypothetical protein